MPKSPIEWTERTWNPIAGCSVVSPGCTNCYAMRMAARIERMNQTLAHYRGLTMPSKAGPVWTGRVSLAPLRTLMEPLCRRSPATYFVNSMSDLFHEDVPDKWIDQIFAVMALSPQHTFQVLTKRSARMREYFAKRERPDSDHLYAMLHGPMMRTVEPKMQGAIDATYPLPNVWLGVSVEDQKRATERRDDLKALARSGWRTFVSYEPALGPVAWTGWEFLSWLISGGESGPGARPTHPDWHRAARDFCEAHAIPYFFKQWGEYYPEDQPISLGCEDHDPDKCDTSTGELMFRVGKSRAGRLLDGVEHNGIPEVRRG